MNGVYSDHGQFVELVVGESVGAIFDEERDLSGLPVINFFGVVGGKYLQDFICLHY